VKGATETAKIILVSSLRKSYLIGSEKLEVLKGVDFEVRRGEFVCIMGPSGSGKSTLMHLLGCLDSPDSGSYILDGVEVSTLSDSQLARVRNQKIGFVFQAFFLIPWATVYENVELPLIYAGIPFYRRRKKVLAALEYVDMQHRIWHKPSQLSGGERQRVAIARAIVNDPTLILADEPTGNLDTKRSQMVMNLFKRLNKQGKTVVIVTHDPEITTWAERVVYVRDGVIEKEEVLKNDSFGSSF